MLDLVYPASPAPIYPRPSIDHPGKPVMSADEMLPLIEPNGLVYGQAGRAWVHSGVLVLHPVVHLHILDRYGKLYLQKRALNKDLLPGYWDTAVGGHVSYGETVPEALFRETSEELGLSAFNPVFLEAYEYKTKRDREFVFVHAMVGHPTLHPNAAEVSEGRWWSIPELEEAMGKDILTPNFESEFMRIKEKLLAML
jgi:isopentenyldiphosphate isomerase